MGELKVLKKGKKVSNFSFLKPEDNIDLYISEHITINLGNYESAKVSVGLTVPVKVKEIDKAKEEVFNYIDNSLNNKIAEIVNE